MVDLVSRTTSRSGHVLLLWRSTSIPTKWYSVGEPSEDRTHGVNSETHTAAMQENGILDSTGILVR
eukprot:12913032-Prorocentrum_lima.AAC.1